MNLLDTVLANLINRAITTRKEASVEELEERDNAEDPTLLRFLVDMRGEDINSKQLRDDLMTMLIAGHETTAAVLTWTLFELLSSDDKFLMTDICAEIDAVMEGKERPNYDDIVSMKKLRFALIESLRLYPEPPILIRRSLQDDILPAGGSSLYDGIKILKGTDIFISTWNLHRSEELWGENSEVFDPTRWERDYTNENIEGWQGYNSSKIGGGLYPNEITSDFAFLPFGGGARKCIGDQFAMMEATVVMAMLLKRFEFTFVGAAEDVGMRTGATIHTMNGLKLVPKERHKNEKHVNK